MWSQAGSSSSDETGDQSGTDRRSKAQKYFG